MAKKKKRTITITPSKAVRIEDMPYLVDSNVKPSKKSKV